MEAKNLPVSPLEHYLVPAMSKDGSEEIDNVGVEANDAEEPGWNDEAPADVKVGKKTKKEVQPLADEEGAVQAIPDPKDEYSLDDKVLFYKERECLLLLLEARKLLSVMVKKKEEETARLVAEKRAREEEEKKRSGRLTVQEIQDMLQNSPEEDDYDMVSGMFHSFCSGSPHCISPETETDEPFYSNRNPGIEEAIGYLHETKPQVGA